MTTAPVDAPIGERPVQPPDGGRQVGQLQGTVRQHPDGRYRCARRAQRDRDRWEPRRDARGVKIGVHGGRCRCVGRRRLCHHRDTSHRDLVAHRQVRQRNGSLCRRTGGCRSDEHHDPGDDHRERGDAPERHRRRCRTQLDAPPPLSTTQTMTSSHGSGPGCCALVPSVRRHRSARAWTRLMPPRPAAARRGAVARSGRWRWRWPRRQRWDLFRVDWSSSPTSSRTARRMLAHCIILGATRYSPLCWAAGLRG